MQTEDVIFEVDGNEARAKYDAALPLSPSEALAVAQVDLDIWTPVKVRANMWQMGRKKKYVDLDIVDGVMTGIVEDLGTLHKEYLYQIEVKLERVERIAVRPVLQPIHISNDVKVPFQETHQNVDGLKKILFITDPHFGFRTEPFEDPVAFHDRTFLSDLLAICEFEFPDYVIWGGDTLDLTDFSRFPNDPAVINKTQYAALEAAWVINQFGLYSVRQVILEGNHDVRMEKALSQNFAAAYQLKPVHDLTGAPLMSVERLMGYDQHPGITYAKGYPDSYFDIGNVCFEHGNIVRKGHGTTASAMMKERTKTTFFGHIHRYEKVSRPNGENGYIHMATPGCACRRQYVPGANRHSAWTEGAFLITMDRGEVRTIEEIMHDREVTYFRGGPWKGVDYLDYMKLDIPPKFMHSL